GWVFTLKFGLERVHLGAEMGGFGGLKWVILVAEMRVDVWLLIGVLVAEIRSKFMKSMGHEQFYASPTAAKLTTKRTLSPDVPDQPDQ
nr:PfkB-like carbohydrate kinase family protein [Tanacetum cinerariifolium]